VRLLGYVYTSYGKRNVSAVRKDIQTYADWPTNSSNPNLAVRGIFFDETPQQYEAQTLTYLQGLTDFVKDLTDLGPDQFVSIAILLKPYSLSHTIHPLSRIILDLYFHFFIVLSNFAFFYLSRYTSLMSLETHYGCINFHPNLYHNGFFFF
jgi:Spherulation-specific family 4.